MSERQWAYLDNQPTARPSRSNIDNVEGPGQILIVGHTQVLKVGN